MKTDLSLLVTEAAPVALIFCAGFEERAIKAANLLLDLGMKPHAIILVTYGGSEHEPNYRELLRTSQLLLGPAKGCLTEISIQQIHSLGSMIERCTARDWVIACDISGLSRIGIFASLGHLKQSGRHYCLLYTEAAEYYPTVLEYQKIAGRDVNDAFFALHKYEKSEVMYSGNCVVEEIPNFQGRLLPNYPLMLIAFLTFKRSRLSAILREYEPNARILIRGAPVRSELKWREDLMNVINFDLLEENRHSVRVVQTLDWRETHRFLSDLYHGDSMNFRFNVILAPLGSKMQTVGSWAFAAENPHVRVVTSTPSEHFADKYSKGSGDTFLIDDVCDIDHKTVRN